MKNIKRIIALCLVFALTAGMSVFAEEATLDELYEKFMSDVTDIERVYKYDFVEARVEETEEESNVLKYPRAVQIVTALEIMEYMDDDNFGEDETVPFGEFTEIMTKLSDVFDFVNTSEYNDAAAVTMGDAVNYIIEAIGYHIFDGKYDIENPRHRIANQLGILKGISFVPDKPVTRGELACMIAAALEIEMIDIASVTGNSVSYEVIEDSSLLYDRFSAILVEGVVTALPGMRLYAGETLEEGTVEIDRVTYHADNLDCSRYFGHKVFAVIEIGDFYDNVISIEISEDDNTLRIPISDIFTADSSKVMYYDEGQRKQVSLGSVTTVTCNGEASSLSLFNDELLSKHGEVILSSGSGYSRYDVAAVRLYQDFVVESVSSFSKKIFFAYGQKFSGKNYISTEIDRDEVLSIIKNDQEISYTALKSGDVVTVTSNSDGSVITMIVSDKVISGTVEEMESDGSEATIGGKDYIVSDAYEKAFKVDSTIPELLSGLSGEFYLSFDNRIVDIKSSKDARRYGYMTDIYQGQGLDDAVVVRMFADDGTWANYNLADKLTFDGDTRTEKSEAYALMQASADEVLYSPVRFSLNSDGEITFLDTARIKSLQLGEVDSELSDTRRIVSSGEWTGTFNWKTNGALTGSKYLLATETTLFTVPDDVDDEEAYFVTKKAKFGSNQEGHLLLYSADDFNMVPLVVQTTSSTLEETDFKYFIVTGIFKKKDKNDEYVTGIKCLDFSGSGSWEMREYMAKSSLPMDDVKVGDVVKYTANSGIIQAYEIKVPFSERDTDISSNLLSYPAYALGTITDISAQNNLIKFKTGTTECVFTPLKLGMHETGSKQGGAVSIGDLQIGDRIFVFGSHKEFYVAVLR